jgi:glutamyl-tRNA reductase
MNLLVTGVNHRAAPLGVRERVAFSADAIAPALERMRSDLGVAEGVILSTCNRVEVYSAHDSPEVSVDRVAGFLERFHRLAPGTVGPYVYGFEGLEVARHLFRVASALDSLVIGETQILGQVKDAYQLAASRAATGKFLNALFQRALQVGKEVQTTTQIGEGHLSIGSVAVDFARRIFRELLDKTVLVVGAGAMGDAVLHHLRGHGIGRILVANRDAERSQEAAARHGGAAVPLEEMEKAIGEADIVLSCAGGGAHLIDAGMVSRALHRRRNRPIYVIDIAVPRSVQPAVNDVDNAYLYDIDDLEAVVERNVETRAQEVLRGEAIVEHAVVRFGRELHVFEVDPILSSMAREFERIREDELRRLLQRLPELGEAERREIETLTHRLTGKLLHRPLKNVKDGALSAEGPELVRVLRRLFEVGE